MSIAKQIRHLVLGEDGILSKAEALALICTIGFTTQMVILLIQAWNEKNPEGGISLLITLGGYVGLNKGLALAKINKK